MSNIGIAIVSGLGIALVAIIGWKWYDYTSTISDLERELEQTRVAALTLQTDLATERKNVEILEETVEDLNSEISKLAVKEQNIQKAYNDLLTRTDSEKYSSDVLKLMESEKWESESCEDIRALLNEISGLKYEDL